jgi:hypothetical protein
MPDEVKRPIPMRAGESDSPIRLNHTTMRGIADHGVGHLRQIIAMSPTANFKIVPGETSEAELAGIRHVAPRAQGGSQSRPISSIMATGETVFDTVKERKCVIVKLNAGYTETTHKPCHRVSDSHGRSWLQKASKLQKLSR